MFRRENLLTVPELKLAGRIDKMTDAQFNSYCQSLNSFIDRFPTQADRLRNYSDSEKYTLLTKTLSDVCDILGKLYADDIVRECRKEIVRMSSNAMDSDDIEAFVEKFILTVSSLSIDIQMSEHRQAPAVSRRAPQIMTAGKLRGNVSILAVDNAVMYLNTLKKLLQEYPYDVTCMTSGNEALEYLRTNSPDIILLDIEMPVMDGYELARRIKQSGIRAPIIFITANSAREYVTKSIEAGAVGLLMKPLRINQLLTKLKEYA